MQLRRIKMKYSQCLTIFNTFISALRSFQTLITNCQIDTLSWTPNRHLKHNVSGREILIFSPRTCSSQFSHLIFHINPSVNVVVSASKIYLPSGPFHNLPCYQPGINPCASVFCVIIQPSSLFFLFL